MVPHAFDESDRVTQGRPLANRLARTAAQRARTVALLTMLIGEDSFSPFGFSGALEISNGIEIGEEVFGIALSDRGFGDMIRIHGGPHGRGMVPHNTGHHGRGVLHRGFGGQIRRKLSALTSYGMTLRAALALENSSAAPRVQIRLRSEGEREKENCQA